MTDQDIEERLATEVMRWHLRGEKANSYWWNGPLVLMSQQDWHPLKSKDQMFLAVDKVCAEKHLWLQLHSPWNPNETPCAMSLRAGYHHWWAKFIQHGCTFWNGQGGDYEDDAPDMLHAIGLALIKTMEAQNE